MKSNVFKIFATIACSWLSGFLLGLSRLTPCLTDREITMMFALSAAIALVVVHKHLDQNKIISYFNRHVSGIHDMMLLDVQELHRKRIGILKVTHNQSMREARDELSQLHTKINHLHGEHDWISTMYQDQLRTNQEQEDRIVFLEVKLKELGQLSPSAATAPFSAPASQISFAKPQRRARGVAKMPSPLSQTSLVQGHDAKKE